MINFSKNIVFQVKFYYGNQFFQKKKVSKPEFLQVILENSLLASDFKRQ